MHHKRKKRGKKSITIQILIAVELLFAAYLFGMLSRMPLSTGSVPESTAGAEMEIVSDADADTIRQVASNYLAVATYSEDGLVDALCEYEHFDRDLTEEVVSSLDTDWQKQADAEVEAYLHMDGHSEKEIREYLKRDLFTKEQTDRAIEANDPDWSEQASVKAGMLEAAGVEKAAIRAELISRGFTEEQTEGI